MSRGKERVTPSRVTLRFDELVIVVVVVGVVVMSMMGEVASKVLVGPMTPDSKLRINSGETEKEETDTEREGRGERRREKRREKSRRENDFGPMNVFDVGVLVCLIPTGRWLRWRVEDIVLDEAGAPVSAMEGDVVPVSREKC